MRYAVVFGSLSIYLGVVAIALGGWFLLLLYLAASFLLLAIAYAWAGPGLLGKRSDGRLSWWSYLLFGPVLLLLWTVWHLQKQLAREAASHEVAPGVWLGRRPSKVELPSAVVHVVDLTAEFPAAQGVTTGRQYIALPTLDGVAPDEARFREVADLVAKLDTPVYLHCAMGHGRSATLAVSVLILRGLASNVGDAEKLLRRSRPGVRLTTVQRRLLVRLHPPGDSSAGHA